MSAERGQGHISRRRATQGNLPLPPHKWVSRRQIHAGGQDSRRERQPTATHSGPGVCGRVVKQGFRYLQLQQPSCTARSWLRLALWHSRCHTHTYCLACEVLNGTTYRRVLRPYLGTKPYLAIGGREGQVVTVYGPVPGRVARINEKGYGSSRTAPRCFLPLLPGTPDSHGTPPERYIGSPWHVRPCTPAGLAYVVPTESETEAPQATVAPRSTRPSTSGTYLPTCDYTRALKVGRPNVRTAVPAT